jgi:hypothetical protein
MMCYCWLSLEVFICKTNRNVIDDALSELINTNRNFQEVPEKRERINLKSDVISQIQI